MQKITPFLWYNTEAEEAANFYVSLFKNSSITHVTKLPDGKTQWVSFILDGVEFMALNGGPMFKFSEAFSMFVTCEDQAEVDMLWDKLSADPAAEQCGWCKDKYGVTWQIIPKRFSELMALDTSGRVMQAMLKMKKLIIADLEAAYAGE